MSDKVTQREKFAIALFYHNFVTGNFQKAIETVALWSQSYPNDPVAREAQAFTYGGLGQYEKALSGGLECVRLDPERSTWYALVLEDYMALGRAREAKATYQQALAHNLDHPFLLMVR